MPELLGPLSEIATPTLNPEIVALLVEEGCERNNADRELVSKLLLGFATAAGSWHATAGDLRCGLNLALDRLDDLVLDTPDADHVIAKFIARAIADEVIAPAYALGFDYGASPRHFPWMCLSLPTPCPVCRRTRTHPHGPHPQPKAHNQHPPFGSQLIE